MSPLDTLRALRQLGVAVELDGDRLSLRASVAAPDHLLSEARRQRDAIAALLRPDHHGWTEEDRLTAIEERAAILEYDQGLPRAEADVLARAEAGREHTAVTPLGHIRRAGPVDGATEPDAAVRSRLPR